MRTQEGSVQGDRRKQHLRRRLHLCHGRVRRALREAPGYSAVHSEAVRLRTPGASTWAKFGLHLRAAPATRPA